MSIAGRDVLAWSAQNPAGPEYEHTADVAAATYANRGMFTVAVGRIGGAS